MSNQWKVSEVSSIGKISMFVVFIFIKLYLMTLRFKTDEQSLKNLTSPDRMIGITWHSRILFLAKCKYFYRSKFPMAGLVSASKDGAYLTELFKWFGISTSRGSSKRRGVLAMMDMAKKIEDGSDVFITPDGPRGPKEKVKLGFYVLAKQTGVRILVLRIKVAKFIKLKTWDNFIVPLPFSKVEVQTLQFDNWQELELKSKNANCSVETYVEAFLKNEA